ncbi:MAG: Uma2 family endonuclease [Verrucomicrobia bacterium]|nr:Uma2 family endonuclease [Cytophagales bacterium]
MALLTEKNIIYPETDGKPMAESTKQFDYIVLIKEGLEAVFADHAEVFVAGDLFWYPVEGNPRIVYAPDVMVVFGRPKGDRKSYLQWQEANIAPQVVFEILSASNSAAEMTRKFSFYQRFGVEEYYVYDPEANELLGWQRNESIFEEIETMQGWKSPLLNIRFELDKENLLLFRADGLRFRTYTELSKEREEALLKMEKLAQKLRELGINPDAIA